MARWWYMWMVLLLPMLLSAQEASFYAEVDRNTVSVDGRIRLDIVFENGSFTDFVQPAFADFNVLNTSQSSSTSINIINGKQQMVRKTTRTYLLQPRSTGTKTIEAATARLDGYVVETKPITITVTAAGTSAGGGSGNVPNPSANRDVFLQVFANKSKAYVGEQILVSYKLFTRQSINNYQEPTGSFPGCWKQDISIKNPVVNREVINGITYRTAIIKQVILFPQQAGALSLPAAEMTADVEYGFFNTRRISLTGNTLTIDIKPLPTPAPVDFSGTTGQLTLASTLTTSNVAVDEPVTLTITVKGVGNMELITLPNLDLPGEFEVYEPKVSAQSNTNGGVMSGSKSYEYLIIPRQPGTYKINPLTFSYFDADKGGYQSLQTEGYEITVTGEASTGGSGTVSGISKEDIALLDEDIRYLMTDVQADTSAWYVFPRTGFWLMAGIPFLLVLLVAVWVALRRETDTRTKHQRQALPVARKSISQAAQLLQQGRQKEGYGKLQQALWTYVADRLLLPAQDLTKEHVQTVLLQHNVTADTAHLLVKLMDTAEMAVYAPIAAADDKTLADKCLDTLTTIDKSLTI